MSSTRPNIANLAENIREEEEKPQKRFKITASNGWRVLPGTKSTGKKDSPSVTPVRRVLKGRLSSLLSLPLDVLFEIFGHLLPQDILHLSWTTKNFRSLLFQKSFIFIWRDALANVPGLPECPPEMSVTAWTYLIFGSYCQNCSAIGRYMDFMLQVRLCGKCLKSCLVSSKDFNKECKKDKIILCCVPFSPIWPGRSISYCMAKAKDIFLKQLLDPERNDVNAFVQEKKAEMNLRAKHAARCRIWLEEWKSLKAKKLSDIREQRKQDIIKELEDLGFNEELAYLQSLDHIDDDSFPKICFLQEHPDVKVPKALTERMWVNMKSEMIDYMADVKLYRIKDERRKLKARRTSIALKTLCDHQQNNFKEAQFRPSPVDVLEWQAVRDIIKRPSDVEVSPEMFATLFDEHMVNFTKDCLSKLESDLSKSSCDMPCSPTVPRLELATCVFNCAGIVHMQTPGYIPNDLHLMWYPEFMHHPCNSICRLVFDDTKKNRILDGNCDLWVNSQFERCRRKATGAELLTFDGKASQVVRNILEACGLDPRTTTVGTLDKLDPRLICLKCTHGRKADGEIRCSVRSWRSAVHHCLKVHWGSSQVAWQKITDEDAETARFLEGQEPSRRRIPLKPECVWRCTRCLDLPTDIGIMTMDRLNNHYIFKHIRFPYERGRHYYRAPECPPRRPLTVEMAPNEVKT